MYLHGTHAFLVLSVFAVQLSLAMYHLPSRKQVQIKFTGSTYTERGRLVGRNTVTQSCNNILLSDCCVALRDIMWMHMHPVHEVYFALYLEFVPSRIEIMGLPDANSIGAAWVNENQNDEPEQKGCQGQFWQYGVGPGDWKVDIDSAKVLEAMWFDASGGINKDAIGGDQWLVDEVTNGKLPKYLDNGQGDMQYESTSKDKGSDRSYIQGLKPSSWPGRQELSYQPQYCAGTTDCPSFTCKVLSDFKSALLLGIESLSLGSFTTCTP